MNTFCDSATHARSCVDETLVTCFATLMAPEREQLGRDARGAPVYAIKLSEISVFQPVELLGCDPRWCDYHSRVLGITPARDNYYFNESKLALINQLRRVFLCPMSEESLTDALKQIDEGLKLLLVSAQRTPSTQHVGPSCPDGGRRMQLGWDLEGWPVYALEPDEIEPLSSQSPVSVDIRYQEYLTRVLHTLRRRSKFNDDMKYDLVNNLRRAFLCRSVPDDLVESRLAYIDEQLARCGVIHAEKREQRDKKRLQTSPP